MKVLVEWFSVEEKLPEDGVPIIYYAPDIFEDNDKWPGRYDSEAGVFYGPSGFFSNEVTHWCYFPNSPSVYIDELTALQQKYERLERVHLAAMSMWKAEQEES